MQSLVSKMFGKQITKLFGYYLQCVEAPFRFITSDISVPNDLSEITVYHPEEEVDPLSVGMTTHGVRNIWSAVEDLYRTGLYPALSFSLRRHGKVVLSRSIGHSRGNGPGEKEVDKVLMTPDTPVCIFSCTKAITAMLVHLLSEKKQISLLDPVSYYIPEFAQNGKKDISIYQLLAHQAGIPKLPDIHNRELEEVLFDHDEMVRRLCATAADRPGQHKRYHAMTSGYILGELVSRVSKMNTRAFLRENIQEPLNFEYFNYGFEPDQAEKLATNYSTGLPVIFPLNLYEKRILGITMEKIVASANDPDFLKIIVPAGNIHATADECAQFFQMLLNGGVLDGTRVFDPLTIRRATVEHGKREVDYSLIIPFRYSAGMMLGGKTFGLFGPNTEKAFGHLGLTNNLCWADPARDISVALLTTGKPVLGFHIFPLVQLLMQISRFCYMLTEAEQGAIAKARGLIGQIDTEW